MNKKVLKFIIISVIIALIVLITFLIISKFTHKDEKTVYLKNYEVNEFIPVYISTQNMTKIYLTDYVYKMRYSKEEAYDLLDEKYREAKFNSIDDFTNYINSLNIENIKMKQYSRSAKKGYVFYTAYDENGNKFIFKTKGVMQYKVYLDEDTVEVGD